MQNSHFIQHHFFVVSFIARHTNIVASSISLITYFFTNQKPFLPHISDSYILKSRHWENRPGLHSLVRT